MPTYEYECAACGKRFDLFQRMSDVPVKRCIHCRGKAQRKIGAGAGLIFKGTGFYATDYKKPVAKPANTPHTDKPKPDTPSATDAGKKGPAKS